MAVPQDPVDEIDRRPVEDDHVDAPAEQELQIARQPDPEAGQARRRIALVEHGQSTSLWAFGSPLATLPNR